MPREGIQGRSVQLPRRGGSLVHGAVSIRCTVSVAFRPVRICFDEVTK